MASILVIDDSELVQNVVTLALVTEGHQVAAAKSMRHGMRKIREASFDLILMDLNMPEVRGEAVGSANAVLIAAAPDQHEAHQQNLEDLTGLAAAVEEWLPPSLPGYGEIVGYIDRLTHRTGAAIVSVTGGPAP